MPTECRRRRMKKLFEIWHPWRYMGFRVSLMNQLSTKVDGRDILDKKTEKSPLYIENVHYKNTIVHMKVIENKRFSSSFFSTSWSYLWKKSLWSLFYIILMFLSDKLTFLTKPKLELESHTFWAEILTQTAKDLPGKCRGL